MALFTAFAPIWRYRRRSNTLTRPEWRYSPPLRQFGAIDSVTPLALRQIGAIHTFFANLAISAARQHPHAARMALFTVFAPIWRYRQRDPACFAPYWRYRQRDPARFAPYWRYSHLLRQFGAIDSVSPLALRQNGAIHRFCANLALSTA
ncbi:hypothetical protein [Alicyclobacillus sp. ALC3]|uniref:hypothetical protein n=1 Tax=Alicyclobacillus sp. ALC3 TaxID=2796143 RepID=UPI002378827D|nr:hypothetical protein [Alicyclobacillus sp. ALC3]WDL98257.1 hypothetical protein JC200_06070 [Alicyclobacillus sp. ALC3]